MKLVRRQKNYIEYLESLLGVVLNERSMQANMITRHQNYIQYLEALVLSLLAERNDPEARIVSTDREFPPTTDVTFSPILVRQEIAEQRDNRDW